MFHDHLLFHFYTYTYILVLVNKLLNPFVYIMIIFFIFYQKKQRFSSFFFCLLLLVYYSCLCHFFSSPPQRWCDRYAQIDKEIINSNTHADIHILSLYFMFISFDFVCLFVFSDVYRRQKFIFFSFAIK